MPFYVWKGHKPSCAENVWIAPDAQVIGRVSLGASVNIWFSCVVRGDVEPIKIGKNTNIQDFSLLHVTEGKGPLIIGENCTIAHRATVHGCTLKDYAFVGIGAVVLDGCSLGEYSLLAAGSLLPPGKEVPARMLAMGTPAKIIREITPHEEEMIHSTPQHYCGLKETYRSSQSFRTI